MTFVDEVPQDWTSPELPELRDLLVLAYRRPTAAEQLADAADIVPGMFPLYDNMRTTWTELIKVMGGQKKLRTLVEKAAEDPAAAAYAPRFQEMLKERPPVAPPQLVGGSDNDWWKGDDRSPAVAQRLYPERLMERRSRLLHVELAKWITEAAQSIAKLSVRFDDRAAHGTGLLIHDDHILTNHHNVVHPDYGKATSLVVEFDYEQGFTGTPLVRKGIIDSIVSNAQDDWAVIRLESAVDRPPLKLGTPYDIGTDDAVVIIQHPKGAYKQFALEPLAVRHVDDQRIQYVADTQQGSSGSPVFNSRMQVIALHHAEAEVTVEVEGKPQVVWRNQGIHYKQVISGLDSQGVAFITD
jgi:Trypsin-like peptidase domain/Effector-associated domain 1